MGKQFRLEDSFDIPEVVLPTLERQLLAGVALQREFAASSGFACSARVIGAMHSRLTQPERWTHNWSP